MIMKNVDRIKKLLKKYDFVVTVSGGVADFHTKNGEFLGIVIDYDNEDVCPYCNTEIDDTYCCPKCNYSPMDE